MSGLSLPSLVREKPTLKHVKAVYTFEGRNNEELSFRAGDIIEVTSMSDKNWYEGRFGGVSGTFPSNYVEDVADEELPTQQKSEQQQGGKNQDARKVTALHNFKARTPDELSFKKGDVINVIRDIDSNFWEGELNNQTGCVPKTYVSEVSATKPRGKEKKSGKGIGQVEAAYDFGGRSADELSFKTGDVIQLIEKVDAAWWKGRLGRKEGVFPANYVKVMEEAQPVKQKSKLPQVGSPSHKQHHAVPRGAVGAMPRGAVKPAAAAAAAAGPIMVKAQFNYTRQNRDELSMRKDEVMTLVAKQDADWWEVMNEEGRKGLVPAAFMVVIEVNAPRQPRGGAKGVAGVAASSSRHVKDREGREHRQKDKEKDKEKKHKRRQKERRKQHRAATKLQSVYRGYNVRVRRHRHRAAGGHGGGDDDYDDDEFEDDAGDDVERLVGHRLKQGVLQLKVRWRGSSPEEDEWFPADALEEEWPHLVEDYQRVNKAALKRLLSRNAGLKANEGRGASSTLGGMNKMGPSRINV